VGGGGGEGKKSRGEKGRKVFLSFLSSPVHFPPPPLPFIFLFSLFLPREGLILRLFQTQKIELQCNLP